MYKLLVNSPSGKQEIIEVSEGGGYFDISRVIWDERVDGPLPEITLGGMVRNGDALVVDQVLVAANVAAEMTEAIIAKHTAINAIRDEKLAAGVPYTFPDVAGTIQTRDEKDFRNILSRAVVGIIFAGQAITMPFRDEEDRTHQLTPEQTVAMGLTASNTGSAIYAAAWAHKDALKALVEGGATITQIESYDITTGWPDNT